PLVRATAVPLHRRVYVTACLVMTGSPCHASLPRPPRLKRDVCASVQGFASGFLQTHLTV
ncbi:hypothetical protein, partial [Ferrimicrobium sp.]|uniref:hypothetical protein n=1 Tax=Ferrimicrobium sp. TaxID=2926050 RepID=UPI002625A68D